MTFGRKKRFILVECLKRSKDGTRRGEYERTLYILISFPYESITAYSEGFSSLMIPVSFPPSYLLYPDFNFQIHLLLFQKVEKKAAGMRLITPPPLEKVYVYVNSRVLDGEDISRNELPLMQHKPEHVGQVSNFYLCPRFRRRKKNTKASGKAGSVR